MGLKNIFMVQLWATFVAQTVIFGTDAVTCGNDWLLFQDSKCLRFFDNFETRDIAAETCGGIPTEPINTARLVSLKSPAEQEFISNWLFNELGLFDNVWLNGDRFNGTTWTWRDTGDVMSFTNWDDNFPTNQSENACIEMSPKVGRSAEIKATEDGKWKDVPCSKRNLVVCEKKPMLTVPELQDMFFQMRDTVSEMRENPVPLGFIYVQLPSHPAPQVLWPTLTWRNASPDYAGLFFRAEGATAGSFGTVQAESSNHLSLVEYKWRSGSSYPASISVPNIGWSAELLAGVYSLGYTEFEGLRFANTGSETRSRNTAVRIWERV